MTTPAIYPIAAFDVSDEQQISFFIPTGGNQVAKNKLSVYNSETNELVYQQTQTTFQARHIIAAGSLPGNATQYYATIITYDANDAESAQSAPTTFWCYTAPTLSFSNVTAGGVVGSSNFEFAAVYSQSEGELIREYYAVLFNEAGNEISRSGTIYGTAALNTTFSGFEDNKSYAIAGYAATVNGTEISTGVINFSVNFIQPVIYTAMSLDNEGGSIHIGLNILSITGRATPEPATYIDNSAVDLTASDSRVLFDEGFSFDDSFLIEILARNSTLFTETVRMGSATSTAENPRYISLVPMRGYFGGTEKFYYSMYIYAGAANMAMYLYSNQIDIPGAADNIKITVKKQSGLYDIEIEAVV